MPFGYCVVEGKAQLRNYSIFAFMTQIYSYLPVSAVSLTVKRLKGRKEVVNSPLA